MTFGKQSGPPASAKQLSVLLELVRAQGFVDFREARHPLDLSQRQAAGKFTTGEAAALIEQFESGPPPARAVPEPALPAPAAERPRGVSAYKRWRMRDGVAVAAVTELTTQRIVPAYERLSPDVTLALELLDDGASVLAIQRWATREARQAAMSGRAFDRWWAGYRPVLAEWDRLVELEAEWETDRLLG